MTEEKVKVKRTRKVVKKFYISSDEKVVVGLTAGEVSGFLSSNPSMKVFDQVNDNEFLLTAPTVNEKFQARTVIAYQE